MPRPRPPSASSSPRKGGPTRLGQLDLREDAVVAGGRTLRLLRPRSIDLLLDAGVADGAQQRLYWADLWPSCLAVADEVAALPLEGRRVLELGCGLGVPSLVAAAGGADVLATDNERDALALLQRNARRLLGRRLGTLRVDVLDPPDALVERGPFDLVVAADVLFRPDLAAAIGRLAPTLLAQDGEAIVGFPWAGQDAPLLAALPPGVGVTREERRSARLGSDVHLLRLRR